MKQQRTFLWKLSKELQNYRGRVEDGRVVIDVSDRDDSFCSCA